MKTFVWVTCFFTTLVILFSISLSSTSQAQQKSITLNYSNFHPPTAPTSIIIEQWCKEIEKRTNGLVKITVFHAGTLTPPTLSYDGVVKGTSDLAHGVFGYHRGRFPLTEFIDLPLGVRNGYAATKLINEYYKKFKPGEMDSVKVMYLSAHGPAILHTAKKTISKLEDVKGMKIRVTGLATPTFKALGTVPVAMPMGEAYDALSKGVVEGINCPTEVLVFWKMGEVLKYTIESFGSALSSGFFYVMNKEKWDSIPPEAQKIIEKVNEEYIEKEGMQWDVTEKQCRNTLLEKGHKFVTLSAKENERWKKTVQPVLDDYVKTMKDKGLPGDEVLKFAINYLKEHQK